VRIAEIQRFEGKENDDPVFLGLIRDDELIGDNSADEGGQDERSEIEIPEFPKD
jgi:hypothetical protein